ncbi:MAG: hypothetical protein QOK37_3140 [Thermoanaerobaculia bacterium]|jgi:hypothetical protein|nr:hypothetical protein [Thermoanaerobaculia bacterium]
MLELYPQLVVGGFETVPRQTWTQFYPALQEVCGASALLHELQDLRAKGKLLEAMKEAARRAIADRGLTTDGRALTRSHPEVESIAVWLDRGDVDCALTALGALGEMHADLASIGDSMLANLVLNEHPLVVETAHRFLKVVWIRMGLNRGWPMQPPCKHKKPQPQHCAPDQPVHEGWRVENITRFWKRGAVSIALELPPPEHGSWPVPGYLDLQAQPVPSTQMDRPDFAAVSNEVSTLRAAKAELDRAYEAQRTRTRTTVLSKEQFVNRFGREDDPAARVLPANGPASSDATRAGARTTPAVDWDLEYEKYRSASNASVLTGEFKQLSPATAEALVRIGVDTENVDVSIAHQAIDERLFAIHGAVGRPRATVPVIQIGSVIVEANPAAFAEIICGEEQKLCHCELLRQLARKHGEKPQVRLLGTGFAYRVQQHLKRYIGEELVHTEPVLGQTKRTVAFRELNRVEEMQETITSHETFDEKVTTSHDQFEFSSEVSRQTEEEHKATVGVTMSATYGPVSLSGSVSASSASASSEASQVAIQNAKEVMTKAVRRIQDKIQERRSIMRIRETERRNSFEIDNVGKPSFTGFYFAINKEYENQLVRVGKRLMLRFAMQQPMAFLLHCLATLSSENSTLEKPIAPSELNDVVLGSLTSFESVDASSYAVWAALYDAQGVKPPPANIVVSHGVANDWPSKAWVAATASIDIPEGYKAVSARVTVLYSPGGGRYLDGFLGKAYFSQNGANLVLDDEQGKIVTTFRGHIEEYAINFVITCIPTAQAMTKWKIETYTAIMEAYNRKKSAYESQVSIAGIAIEGRNPLANKLLVEQELQKFILGALYPPFYYRGFDSMKFGYKCGADGLPVPGSMPIPEPDFKDANDELPWVTFFLSLLELKNITYDFLPYDFGKRDQWCSLRRLQDVDPFFENAISAGYVVVDIPVAAHMTDAFLYFYQTQDIWSGGDIPLYGDPMFQEIAIAIKESEDLTDGTLQGDPWTTVVPTPLVYVQDKVPADL